MDKIKIAKGEIARTVLGVIGAAGFVGLAIAAPNAIQIIPKLARFKFPKRSTHQCLERLKKRGLIRVARGRHGWRAELTEKGKKEWLKYQLQGKLLPVKKRWDKKWRLLIFDIEEQKKSIRDAVRNSIRFFGFYRLQDSVWVTPYDCEEILELLRTAYHVRYDALYIVAESIANDQELRRHFDLR